MHRSTVLKSGIRTCSICGLTKSPFAFLLLHRSEEKAKIARLVMKRHEAVSEFTKDIHGVSSIASRNVTLSILNAVLVAQGEKRGVSRRLIRSKARGVDRVTSAREPQLIAIQRSRSSDDPAQ